MVPWRATEEGYVTDEVIEWYERFARGMPGAIVVEATGIRDVPSGPLLRIGHDRFLPGLRRLVETVRRASGGRTRLLVQLIDFLAVRRRPEPRKFFERFLAITDRHRAALGEPHLSDAELRVRLSAMSEDELAGVLARDELEALQFGYRERVTDMYRPHIRNLPQVLPGLFAEAAVRAEEAGFDGVELHYAHAYTMSSFLSRTNTRPDDYGGLLENRARLPLEVLAAIRGRVSNKLAVGVRYLAEECIEGGNRVEDAVYFGVAFARAGVHFISLSRGGKFDDAKQPAVGGAVYPYTGRAATSACRSLSPTNADRSEGMLRRPPPSVKRCARPAVRCRWCAPVASIISKWPRTIWRAAFATSSVRRANLWPIRIGFAKSSSALGREVRLCEYTNYCEGL